LALADEARAAVTRQGPTCSVCLLLTSPIGDELAAALADPTLQSTAIERALLARDEPVGRKAVERHRRGDCAPR
jgi:hypothetical protein